MEGSPFVPLLIITFLAVAVPVLASHTRPVRAPLVVGEILAGMAIGKSGLNLVSDTAILVFLAEFGFTYLMFLSGLEINLGLLVAVSRSGQARPLWRQPLVLAGGSFGLTLLMAAGIGVGLVEMGLARHAVLIGLVLSTTSLGVVVPVLKERRLTGSVYGQTLMVVAIIGDFATLLLLSLALAWTTGGLGLEVLLVLALVFVFIAAVRVLPHFQALALVERVIADFSHATGQIDVRMAFALMVAWSVLAEMLGAEVILGAFLAGVLVSMASRGEAVSLRNKLDAIGYGFFIPIFFILVGASFDLGALVEAPQAWLLVLVLIGSAYAVKLLPALLYRLLFPWRETLAAGTLISARLSLILAAASVLLDLGEITAATHAALVLVAIVTSTVSPLGFARILPHPGGEGRQGRLLPEEDIEVRT